MLKVAIAGRPNVGKSSLFNKLTRSRDALVHNMPGVTRDVINGVGRIGELEFELIDTAGIEKITTTPALRATPSPAKGTFERGMTGGAGKSLNEAISGLAVEAVKSADVILFVVDGAHGVHPADESIAREVRRLGKPVLLIINKADVKKTAANAHEFLRFGLGEGVRVSAEHNLGFEEIGEWIQSRTTPAGKAGHPATLGGELLGSAAPTNLRVAIMGRPNVGKSTLINKIIGEKRMLAFDQPGITRDVVQIPFSFGGRELVLADTPGLRRKAKVVEDIETLAALKALALIDDVDVVVLVLDATAGVERYDMNIAARVSDAGKVLIVALNKWDKVEEVLREDLLLKLKHDFKDSFNQIVKPVMLPISAESGSGVKNLMKRVLELADLAAQHLPTSFVNRIVEKLVKKSPPPRSRLKRPMKIKFAAQTGERPPVITLYVGEIVELPESYERYLRNGLARELGWDALPVRIAYKRSENPYGQKT
ncbi:MAG: ribosome biogenesis GTPase Der [Rickettsiales bacterium]|nr:ribosome biogenesis GTPase Der [Rickettsiales bacterium]